MLDRFVRVPGTRVATIELRQERNILPPRQLANGLLANCPIALLCWPSLSERAHVLEIRSREASDVRELPAKVGRQPVDDPATPTLTLLPHQDLAADLPVEADQLAVDGEYGAGACRHDPCLDLGKELWVLSRHLLGAAGRRLSHGFSLIAPPHQRLPRPDALRQPSQ
jgi:hypothetical protein